MFVLDCPESSVIRSPPPSSTPVPTLPSRVPGKGPKQRAAGGGGVGAAAGRGACSPHRFCHRACLPLTAPWPQCSPFPPLGRGFHFGAQVWLGGLQPTPRPLPRASPGVLALLPMSRPYAASSVTPPHPKAPGAASPEPAGHLCTHREASVPSWVTIVTAAILEASSEGLPASSC